MIDWLKCLLGAHDWTCDADQNIAPPDADHIEPKEIGRLFHIYARPWCSRCRFYMQPSKHLFGSNNWDATVKYRP